MENSEKYLSTSRDDIVFDGRNKAYGGYVLRRMMRINMLRGFYVALLLAVVLAVCSFLPYSWFHHKKAPELMEVTHVALSEPPPLASVPEPMMPSSPPPPAEALQEMQPADNVPDAENNPQDQEQQNDTGLHGNGSDIHAADTSMTGSMAGVTGGHGSPDSVYFRVEQPPEFPGGTAALYNYLRNNTRYPEVARLNGIKGTVTVSFIVNEDGSVSDVKVKRGIGGGCDEEAARVVRNMPNWKPGKQGGVPVRVIYSIPMNFSL